MDKFNHCFIHIWYGLSYLIIYIVKKLIDFLIFVKSIRKKFHKGLINHFVFIMEYLTLSILNKAKIQL